MFSNSLFIKDEADRLKARTAAAAAYVAKELGDGIRADFFDQGKGQHSMASLITFTETVIEAVEAIDDVANRMAASRI